MQLYTYFLWPFIHSFFVIRLFFTTYENKDWLKMNLILSSFQKVLKIARDFERVKVLKNEKWKDFKWGKRWEGVNVSLGTGS